MTWSLLILSIVNGTFVQTDIKVTIISMMNKEACIRAGNEFKLNSKGIGLICVSSETGEVIRLTQ